MTIILLSFLNFFLNQFVVFYQLIISTRYMSAKYLMFKPEKLNLTYFLCQMNPALLVVILCIRDAKLINCLIETGLGTVDFLKRVNHKTLKQMQHVIVKDQIAIIIFIEIAHYVLLLYSGLHFILWRVPSDGAFYIIYLHVFTVVHIFVLFYNWFSSEKLVSSSHFRVVTVRLMQFFLSETAAMAFNTKDLAPNILENCTVIERIRLDNFSLPIGVDSIAINRKV